MILPAKKLSEKAWLAEVTRWALESEIEYLEVMKTDNKSEEQWYSSQDVTNEPYGSESDSWEQFEFQELAANSTEHPMIISFLFRKVSS
jgi:hypothetical protein